jgi:hypothetical protein
MHTRTSLTRAALLGAALLCLLGSACQVERDPDRNSVDGSRLTAIEIPLNRVVIDKVDVINGDKTDWKYFTVTSPGVVTITVSFDNEVEANPGARLHNAVGQIMSDLERADENDQLRRVSFQAKPGNYYLSLFVEELASDYTCEVKFQENN